VPFLTIIFLVEGLGGCAAGHLGYASIALFLNAVRPAIRQQHNNKKLLPLLYFDLDVIFSWGIWGMDPDSIVYAGCRVSDRRLEPNPANVLYSVVYCYIDGG